MTPRRRTVATGFSLDGVGVHTAAPCTALVQPTERMGAGIIFTTPAGRRMRASPYGAVAVPGMTALKNGSVSVGVIEHLMAAFVGTGITDAEVTVFGPELPILDGSAAPWCKAIRDVGVREGEPLEPLRVTRVVRVEDGDSWAEMRPCERGEVTVHVDFGGAVRGDATVVLEGDNFVREVAWARTFALERDISPMRRARRGRGADLSNTLVVRDDGTVLNPGGTRSADEVVRHKLLDAVGDLGLLGRPVLGQMTVHKGSHRLHLALVQAVAKRG